MLKKILLGLLVVLLLGAAAFVIWGSTPLRPMPQALQALQSDAQVQVTQDRWVIFQPVGAQPQTGLILYPGGRVDYRAYAPLARTIAAEGYLVVLVPMPLNLAVFGSERAGAVIAAFPAVQHWAIGGHSLGGAMAAHYAAQHPAQIEGLVLWAAYPAEADTLAGQDVQVLSVYGTQDGLATPTKIAASRPLLPDATEWAPIVGGNHGQFGWYGPQGGDNEATISREAQQALVAQATVRFLDMLRGGNAGWLLPVSLEWYCCLFS